MRLKFPSSRGSFRVRISLFDFALAALSPLLALYFGDSYLLSSDGALAAFLYCGVSLIFSILAFLAFRLDDGITRYFSVYDALNIMKAVVAAGLMTSLVLFTITRLAGIPRSTPVLQVLILAAGLLTARMIMLLFENGGRVAKQPQHSTLEHIIIIGSTHLSALYIKFIRAYAPDRHRIIAVLDSEQKLIGRAMCGVPIIAPPQQLESVIEEFAVHGVSTDRVIIGGDENFLTTYSLNDIRRICEQRDIALQFVPSLIGLQNSQPKRPNDAPKLIQNQRQPVVDLPAYFRFKRFVDFLAAFAAVTVLSPLFLIAGALVLIDVGSPVLFWQRRLGQNSHGFFLHKFRTLQPPFDRYGQLVPENQRISWIGRLLRDTRLDELPQLFNVFVGDMSLIGPRPLLPHDQPLDSSLRLMVRPGITGWAQINGGNLVTPEEKGALDEFYIRHASVRLDLRIALLTLRFLFTGERRSEEAVCEANDVQQTAYRWTKQNISKGGSANDTVASLQTNAIVRSGQANRTTSPIKRFQ